MKRKVNKHLWKPTLSGLLNIIVCIALSQATLVHGQSNDPAPVPKKGNQSSQRYVEHQAFAGGVYDKDSSIWVYDQAFADLFGMPPEFVDEVKGVTAAAFRVEYAVDQSCGWGGNPAVCSPNNLCFLDMYFDESKTPLPWAPGVQQSQWVPLHASLRWLRSPVPRPKPNTFMATAPNPDMVRNEVAPGLLAPFWDSVSKREVKVTTNSGNSGGNSETVSRSAGIMGYSREFLDSLSVVSVQMACDATMRSPLNLRLDAKREIGDPPIAKFNRIELPKGFIARVRESLKEMDKREREFFRSLFAPK